MESTVHNFVRTGFSSLVVGVGLAAAVAQATAVPPVTVPIGDQVEGAAGDRKMCEVLDWTPAQIEAEFGERVREAIRRRNGEGLSAVNTAVATRSPLTGTEILVFKVTDRKGSRHQVVLDAFGRELDPAFVSIEKEELARRRGPVNAHLQKTLGEAAPGATLPVLIWVRMPEEAVEPLDFDAGLGAAVADGIERRLRDRHDLRTKAESSKMVARMDALGLAAEPVRFAPMVKANLDAEGIRRVAALPEVLEVSLDVVNHPFGNVQRTVVGAATVNGRGITGTGQKVGVIEVGGRVSSSIPWLTGYVQNQSNSCLDDHAALVAGVIDSTHADYRGISTGSQLWIGGSCSGNTAQLLAAMNGAVAWGCRSLNLSWGSYANEPDANCRFIDNMVRNQRITIAIAAGNFGDISFWPYVANPATAFNAIAVGNVDDRNTVQVGDDIMAPSSSWEDPPSIWGDRQKPEIAAPGTNIRGLVNTSPYVNSHPGGTGTSFAAPAVTAVSALLMQRKTTLRTWPETVKAILMATAIQNVEGAARLSERDGAGGLRADLADDVARGVRGGSGGVTYSCSSAAFRDLATIPLVAGKRTRVVICWNTDPNYAYYAHEPSADLDLIVRRPNGSIAEVSASFDNSYEIVDFVPSAGGNYKIQVEKFRCDGSPGYVGWAWWRAE